MNLMKRIMQKSDQKKTKDHRKADEKLVPEVEWAGDGFACMTMVLPISERVAEYAALEMVEKMGWKDAEVIHKQVLQSAEGTYVEV